MFGGFLATCNLGFLYAYVYHFINSRTFIKPKCLIITCLNIIVSHRHVNNSCNFVLKTEVIEYLSHKNMLLGVLINEDNMSL